MSLTPIKNLDDPRLELYRSIKDAHLRAREGLFVVEGRENLRCMLESSPFEPVSVLVSPPAWEALGELLSRLDPAIPVYRVAGPILRDLAGFDLHRGCLALGERPPDSGPADLIQRLPPSPEPSCVVVLENLGNHDNVGGIFRSARALGADAVVMCPRSCDPLYRKAIRVSMGASLCVPWVRDDRWPTAVELLRKAGYAALALDPGGEPMADDSVWPARVALILGTEGQGLSEGVRRVSDRVMRIPMAARIDSLNVNVAAGIALHRWREATHASGEAQP
ncbi:MAG: RNA methyltransferase [Myxococcota bacterium]